jgi:hypothetical protein
MAHDKELPLSGSVVGDEEGGSWQRCQANHDKHENIWLVMGKSRDQRMPLGRSTGPKPELPGFGEIFPYPNKAVV